MTKRTEIRTNRYRYFTDENNILQDEFESWYENEQLCEYGSYCNGDLHGEIKRWHDNGRLCEHGFHEHGIPHGEYKHWHYNSQLRLHKFYDHGKDITEKAMQYLDNDVMFALVINVPRLPKL